MTKSKNDSPLPKGYVPLSGSERHPVKEAKLIGPADAGEVFEVSIILRQRTDGLPLPDFDYFAKTPPDQRTKYSQEEFARKFGAHPDDINKVVQFAEQSGLKVIKTDLAWRTVRVSGTVAVMSKAFVVTLGRYHYTITRRQGKNPQKIAATYRGLDGSVHIPKDLAEIIVSVIGLDNRNISHRCGADPGETYYLPVQQVARLYDFPTNSAVGQTIGIVSMASGWGGYIDSDLQSYFGAAKPTVIPITVDGTGNAAMEAVTKYDAAVGDTVLTLESVAGIQLYSWVDPLEATVVAVDAASSTIALGNWDDETNQWYVTPLAIAIPAGTHIFINLQEPETTLDICVAASAAPGANIAMYFSTGDAQGWIDLINRVASPLPGDPICKVLSCSWFISGGDDPAGLQAFGVSPNDVDSISQTIYTAVVLGGLTICVASGDWGTDSLVGDGKAHVIYPASDPYVLSVGGTTIGNIGKNNDPLAFDEYVWNDWGATGGGVSDYFDLPSYQLNAGVPKSINDNTRVGRGVPDVAANSSPYSGYFIYFGGHLFPVGGTSAAAPLWAGLIAVINAALGRNVGFINPSLYSFGEAIFNDISAPPGPLDNGYNGVPGYPAGPGWDACTGLGSPKGEAILNALKALGPHLCIPMRFCSPELVMPCTPRVICNPIVEIQVCNPVNVEIQPGLGGDPMLRQQIEIVKRQVAILRAEIEEKEKQVKTLSKKKR